MEDTFVAESAVSAQQATARQQQFARCTEPQHIRSAKSPR
jgi:hypothetical protein